MKNKGLVIGAAVGISTVIGCIVGKMMKKTFQMIRGSADISQAGIARPIEPVNAVDVGFRDYGHHKHFTIVKDRAASVLITGAGSYIGESFKDYVAINYPNIQCTSIDMVDGSWREHSFKDDNGQVFSTVFHVAGIAHADVGNTPLDVQEKYYKVNTDLAIECCKKAKEEGVKQFVFMSSMIVYGGQEHITENTLPQPENFYGNSKWLADVGVRKLSSDEFNVAVLRAPMIYGRNSKGNYSTLVRIARKVPFFPAIDNSRSMLYIENLCEFVAQVILCGTGGVFFPQNSSYSNTSCLVQRVAEANGKHIHISKALTPLVNVARAVPIKKLQGVAEKAFGNSFYDMKLSQYAGLEYQGVSLDESIRRSGSIISRHLFIEFVVQDYKKRDNE